MVCLAGFCAVCTSTPLMSVTAPAVCMHEAMPELARERADHGAETGFRIAKCPYIGATINNRKEVIQCLIVYRRGRRQS